MANDVTNESNQGLTIDVENIIRTKAPKAYKYVPRFVVAWLKRILHQEQVNRLIVRCADVYGVQYAEEILKEFGVATEVSGLDAIGEGRYVFASNHPLGGLDGIAFIKAVGERWGDIKFPVNDILLFVKNFSDIFLPVNKIGTTGRQSALRMEEAFASGSQILMFPAGLCSRKRRGTIADLDWKKGFISKAVQSERDVVPVHISGQNSSFFYNLSRVRKALGIKFNIEMLYLVDEMYKQRANCLHLTFGKPIPWQTFAGRDANECAQEVKKMVYALNEKKEK